VKCACREDIISTLFCALLLPLVESALYHRFVAWLCLQAGCLRSFNDWTNMEKISKDPCFRSNSANIPKTYMLRYQILLWVEKDEKVSSNLHNYFFFELRFALSRSLNAKPLGCMKSSFQTVRLGLERELCCLWG